MSKLSAPFRRKCVLLRKFAESESHAFKFIIINKSDQGLSTPREEVVWEGCSSLVGFYGGMGGSAWMCQNRRIFRPGAVSRKGCSLPPYTAAAHAHTLRAAQAVFMSFSGAL